MNWRIFKEGYYKIRGQVLEARLFVDEVLGGGGGRIGNVVFSAHRRRIVEPDIRRTKVKDVLEGIQCKEKVEIERKIGIVLTWAEYFRLRQEINQILGEFIRGEDLEVQGENLGIFIRRTVLQRAVDGTVP
jgi:hypothetical protein